MYNQLSLCMLVVVSHLNQSEIHCINPNCHRPYPQPWGNRFCSSCGSPLQLVDRYIPLRQLGTGGFAQIYTVWDSHTQTEKVLKVLLQNSAKALDLFVQEAKVLANLNHPGVPHVDTDGYFQVHLSDPSGQINLPCLVMEKINGLTLEEIQKQYPHGCPQEMVLNWLLQAVDILQHLHQRHIIHRDIKPSNLMLRNSSSSGLGGELVLIDFGGVKQFRELILKRQNSSTRLFSSGYSPPEQIDGAHVGVQADFYALGRTMIVLLTGKQPSELENPFNGEFNWLPEIQKTGNDNINHKLINLLNDMVQQDVKLRPANAGVLHRRLSKIVKQVPVNKGLTAIKPDLQTAIANLIQAIAKVSFNLGKTCLQIIKAFFYTIWAIILTTIGAGTGIFSGFIVSERTLWSQQITDFVHQTIPSLATGTQTFLGSEMILFMSAGLGTAWGLTTAGVFGQRRRYLVASLMGITGYGLGYFVGQLMQIEYGEAGILGGILVAISLLTLGLGLPSHYIVHAIIAAYGTAITLSLGISLNLPVVPLQWGNLWGDFIFFGLVGISISFWLAVSYYLIVPILRLIGWR
ncbi:serine/threonine-protein kinase [Calothrix rhizosoleniae]|uniref:serine/threonine-protein kinase n=1 Tax=Calothrix rhizosoleniae TaxID=888997 RepID=UPI002E10954E